MNAQVDVGFGPGCSPRAIAVGSRGSRRVRRLLRSLIFFGALREAVVKLTECR